MSPQQAAHLRMMESLPKRTHKWKPIVSQWGIKRTKREDSWLREQLIAAHANGMSRTEMLRAFHISTHTVVKLLGRVQGVKQARPSRRKK